MLVEIRRYTIVPGRRDEFVAWFEAEFLPIMEAAGMHVIGHFVDVENPDAFYYVRSFADAEQRDRQYAAVYETDGWEQELKPYALALETSVRVETVVPGARSNLR